MNITLSAQDVDSIKLISALNERPTLSTWAYNLALTYDYMLAGPVEEPG